MHCRIVDLRNKEVIHVKTGLRIGCVCDVEVDMKSANLVGLVIYGRLRWCGLLGREEDIVIKWSQIEVIGEDTILVNDCDNFPRRKHRFQKFRKTFRFLKAKTFNF